MNLSKRKALMKTFAISHFNYCSLVSMFHSRKLNHHINSIHERALRVKYQDYHSTFLQLLQKDSSVTIHQRNLQILAAEIFKAKNDLSAEIRKEVFELSLFSTSRLFSHEQTFFVTNTSYYAIIPII